MKKEVWKYIKIVSIILFITSIIGLYIILRKEAYLIYVIFLLMPILIPFLLIIFILSIIGFIFSSIKLKKIKKLESGD